MKNYLFAFSALIVLLLGYTMYPLGNGDPKDKEAVVIDAVVAFMKANHYKPSDFNDEFSQLSFDKYIEYLDGSKRFFTKEDIEKLSVYRNRMDDELEVKSVALLDLSDEIATKAIERAEKYFTELKDFTFDFSKKENIELDRDKTDYAEDEKQLKDVWRKFMKYDILNRYESSKISQEKSMKKDSTYEVKSDEEFKKEAQEKSVKNLERWFERIKQTRRSDRFDMYINAIMHTYDPHSDYFTPKSKEDFDVRFSGRLEGIGARLSSEDGFTKVASVVPGGPAWKSKELEPGDLITMVAQDGEEPLNIEGLRLDDVVSKIRGKKGTKVILTVKKQDGSIIEVEIIRDIIIMEEGNAKSALVHLEGVDQKVGYINLPNFYADFNDKNGRNCYRDIKKELSKLKEEQVDGVILDLRYNGGGSLNDVVKIGGLFIEEGPIVQVKSKKKKPYLYNDEDKNVYYDGPLVIMVNESSASASEILAAAMQDYNRAIIVGSKSTFGKGTVQRFYDLDRFKFLNEYKPLGQVKLTVQKFFRINGGSTQLKGVESDIVFPNPYSYINTGEKDYDQALSWTEVKPVEYHQNVHQIKNKEQIIENSLERIKNNPTFKLVEEKAKIISDNKEDTNYSLNESEFFAKEKSYEEMNKRFENLGKDSLSGFDIHNLPVDMAHIQADSSRIARNDNFLSKLHKDIYLEEAVLILNDVILNQKN